MNYIITIASVCVSGVALLWGIAMLRLLYRMIFKKEKLSIWDTFPIVDCKEPATKQKKIKWSILVFAAIFLYLYDSQTVREIVGVHSIYAERQGTYCYYVEVERNGHKYTVPGEITIEFDVQEDSRGRRKTTPRYYINRVYFSNGEFLDFTECGYNYVTDLKNKVSVTDQDDAYWSCQILNEHAYCEQIKETSHISAKSVIELIATLGIVIYNWAGYLCWDDKSMELNEI